MDAILFRAVRCLGKELLPIIEGLKQLKMKSIFDKNNLQTVKSVSKIDMQSN